MKILSAPKTFSFDGIEADLKVALYAQPPHESCGSIGAGVAETIRRRKLSPSPRAWDFLSIALSCYAADLAGHRKSSPDGWTRRFELSIAVNDPKFWTTQKLKFEAMMGFLTTDIWTFEFLEGGYHPAPPKNTEFQKGDSVALLSGGLDSLIGAIDLVVEGYNPVTVSHVSRGDRDKQETYPKMIGGGLPSILLSHGGKVPGGEAPASQRSRSIVFISYAVLVATCLEGWSVGKRIECFVSENGFISINPSLTDLRVGSLSTRTTHPAYFGMLGDLFESAGFNLDFINRYRLSTKGEMLVNCRDQKLLAQLAHTSTSCGRFLHFNYNHCGRCVPCLVRRAAFLRWGKKDETSYLFEDLGKNDENHAGFDDVRAAAMACIQQAESGTERWVGASLVSAGMSNYTDHLDMLERGLNEIHQLLIHHKVL